MTEHSVLLFAEPWTAEKPTTTPRGLKDPARAARAFSQAVEDITRRYGDVAIAWGDVHRVRRGTVDVPVGGCGGVLGCFRVLNFATNPDGKRSVIGGDGWVLAVEFGAKSGNAMQTAPRAYSVLGYGQSPREDSPYFSDQAAMFASGEMKRVAFIERDIEAQTVKRYRPGVAP